MNQFNENQTQSEITTAITAGGFSQVVFAVVGPDSQYPQGSVSVVLLFSNGNTAGYRTPIDGLSAGKTYVASLISGHSLSSEFLIAVVDDGTGATYTLGEVEAW